jgi:hypothetical protein
VYLTTKYFKKATDRPEHGVFGVYLTVRFFNRSTNRIFKTWGVWDDVYVITCSFTRATAW